MMKKRRIPWWPAIALVVFSSIPNFVGGYISYLLALTGIYVICALGVNLLTGYTGQVTVGHGGFLAIGAYTSALMEVHLGTSVLPGIIMGGLAAACLGFLLGIIALRLAGAFLAIATLGFALAVGQIVLNWDAVFQGRAGIMLSTANIFGYALGDIGFYYFVLVAVVLFILLTISIVRSAVGRAFIAVRDKERAAQAMGINLTLYKTFSFALSAFYVGAAGALYAHQTQFLAAEVFNIWISVDFLVAVVIGGLASIFGSVLGGAFVVLVPYFLGELKDFSFILFGVALIVTLRFAPEGLSGLLHRFWKWMRQSTVKTQRSNAEVTGSPAVMGLNHVQPAPESDPHVLDKQTG